MDRVLVVPVREDAAVWLKARSDVQVPHQYEALSGPAGTDAAATAQRLVGELGGPDRADYELVAELRGQGGQQFVYRLHIPNGYQLEGAVALAKRKIPQSIGWVTDQDVLTSMLVGLLPKMK